MILSLNSYFSKFSKRSLNCTWWGTPWISNGGTPGEESSWIKELLGILCWREWTESYPARYKSEIILQWIFNTRSNQRMIPASSCIQMWARSQRGWQPLELCSGVIEETEKVPACNCLQMWVRGQGKFQPLTVSKHEGPKRMPSINKKPEKMTASNCIKVWMKSQRRC